MHSGASTAGHLGLLVATVLVFTALLCRAIPAEPIVCQPAGSLASCKAIQANMLAAAENHTAPGIAATAERTRAPPAGGPKLMAFQSAVGTFTYDESTARVTVAGTQWDMASCSKIMGTTTATAQLYQRGYLDLDMKVADPSLLGPDFAAQGKANITIRNLLLHNAGFPPDPNPGYSSPLFPCPQNRNYHPGQDFSCVPTIYADLLFNQTIVTPPGEKFVYSDLSMITLMFVIGKVVERHHAALLPSGRPPLCAIEPTSNGVCWFYSYIHENIFKRYKLHSTDYVPANALRTAPQWNDIWYHHGLIAGYVSDQNAYALGGVAGHAGVFSTAADAAKFMRVWLTASDPEYLNQTTIDLFTTVVNITQSSRALGWDTNDQPDPPCGSMSPKTFLHIGFTGTQLCGDPTTGVFTTLLGNGRYPHYHHDGFIDYRPVFNSLIEQLFR